MTIEDINSGIEEVETIEELPHDEISLIEAASAAMERHLCRCGTYGRIRRAIHRAAGA